MQAAPANAQITLGSVARTDNGNSAFKLQLKGGAKMLNMPPRSVERGAKLASSAVPELSRVNSDLPPPVKLLMAQHLSE